MKRISLIAIVAVFQASTLVAQDVIQKGPYKRAKQENDVKTLFDSKGSFGGFLGFNMKVGDVNGQSALLLGGSISSVFSSKVNIGLAGYGLTTHVDGDTYDQEGELYQLDMGYGGLLIEPVIANKEVVHLTVPLILGAGGAGLRRDRFPRPQDPNGNNDNYYYHHESDAFVVIEPGLNVEINLMQNIRMGIGASYRYIYDNDLEGLSDSELSGFTGNIGFKFGWF